MLSFLKRLWRQESGQDAAEYALLIVGIAIVVVGAIYAFGQSTGSTFGGAAQTVIGGSSGGSGGRAANGDPIWVDAVCRSVGSKEAHRGLRISCGFLNRRDAIGERPRAAR